MQAPPVQLRMIFGAVRRNGRDDFDIVWREALYGSPRCATCRGKKGGCPACHGTGKNPRRIQWPYSKEEREDWIEALEGTKESFRCGYLGIRDPGAEWVAALVRLLEQNGPVLLSERQRRRHVSTDD